MQGERGSITIPCLIICLLLTFTAHLALLWCSREQDRLENYWRGYQLRFLNGSIYQIQSSWTEGEHLLWEGMLQPGKEQASIRAISTSSEDGLINSLELSAAAANHAGAVQRLRRLRFNISPAQQHLGGRWALVAKALTGAEYLSQAALYTSIEEVALPQVKFLQNKCLGSLSVKNAELEGLSNCFYYLSGNNMLSISSSKPLYGEALIASRRSIKLGSGCRFPNRLVLISEEGHIDIGANTVLSKALVMARGTVTIAPGCQINGLIIADKIVLQGSSVFTADAEVVAPFTSAAFLNLTS